MDGTPEPLKKTGVPRATLMSDSGVLITAVGLALRTVGDVDGAGPVEVDGGGATVKDTVPDPEQAETFTLTGRLYVPGG